MSILSVARLAGTAQIPEPRMLWKDRPTESPVAPPPHQESGSRTTVPRCPGMSRDFFSTLQRDDPRAIRRCARKAAPISTNAKRGSKRTAKLKLRERRDMSAFNQSRRQTNQHLHEVR